MDTLEKTKALFAKVKIAFEEFNTPPAAPAAAPVADFYEGALTTGEQIRATPALQQGATVSLISAEGELPLPDGNYELADGTTVDVLEGAITTVTIPAPAEPAAPAPDPAMVAMSEQLKAVTTENEGLKKALTDNKTAHDLKFSELEKSVAKQGELSNLMFEAMEALMNTPAAAPTQAVKTEKVQMSAVENAEDYFKRIKSLKTNITK